MNIAKFNTYAYWKTENITSFICFQFMHLITQLSR